MVDGPHRGVLVQAAVPHLVAVFGPVAFVGQPQLAAQGFEDGVGLVAVGRRIETDRFGDAGRLAVGVVVIGCRMGHGAARVVERIARPDAAVGVVEMVAVGVEVALLPLQMAVDDRKYPPCVVAVAGPCQVAQQFVDVAQIHVVVRHLLFLARATGDVAVAVHRCAPAFFCAGEVERRILPRMRVEGRRAGRLVGRIGVEMPAGPFMPAQGVAHVGAAPAAVGRPPAHGAVQPHFAAPQSVGRQGQRFADGRDVGVGRADRQRSGQFGALGFRLGEPRGQRFGAEVGARRCGVNGHIARLARRKGQRRLQGRMFRDDDFVGRQREPQFRARFAAVFHFGGAAVNGVDVACAVGGLEIEAVGFVHAEVAFAVELHVGRAAVAQGCMHGFVARVGQAPQRRIFRSQHLCLDFYPLIEPVDHPPGFVARRAVLMRNVDPEIAAHAGQVESEFGHVAALQTESRVGAVERPVEARRAVGRLGAVARRAVVQRPRGGCCGVPGVVFVQTRRLRALRRGGHRTREQGRDKQGGSHGRARIRAWVSDLPSARPTCRPWGSRDSPFRSRPSRRTSVQRPSADRRCRAGSSADGRPGSCVR